MYACVDEGISAGEAIGAQNDQSCKPLTKQERRAEAARQSIREMLEWYRDREYVDLDEIEPDDMFTHVMIHGLNMV